ncbi:T9SS type A sorting domain-containing protein [Sphingobacteriaceae bacterium AH-315-L07]|nr:T9SS type A sorting domain-containing protein [Sphingobacteriaceae bacterium AH-315-L07]
MKKYLLRIIQIGLINILGLVIPAFSQTFLLREAFLDMDTTESWVFKDYSPNKNNHWQYWDYYYYGMPYAGNYSIIYIDDNDTADTYIFSPYLKLYKGVTYTIRYYQRVISSSYPENLRLIVNDSKDNTSILSVLNETYNVTNTTFQAQEATFIPTETKQYTFGWQCFTPAGQGRAAYIDSITVQCEKNMTIETIKTNQKNLKTIYVNYNAPQQVLQIKIETGGDINPLKVDSITFSTDGSTNAAKDIKNAQLFYNDGKDDFESASAKGDVVSTPVNSFTIKNINQTLVDGANYFYLAFELNDTAKTGNTIDAACLQIHFNDSVRTPKKLNPKGIITIENTSDMAVADIECFQNDIIVGVQTTDNYIIGVNIKADGLNNPLQVSSLTFNTGGSSNPSADIENARLYYTGDKKKYSKTLSPIGNVIANPNGTFIIDGFTKQLEKGNNYFWLSYDIKVCNCETGGSATVTNLVDAECIGVTIDGLSVVPSITSPTGNREIAVTWHGNVDDSWHQSYNWTGGIAPGGSTGNMNYVIPSGITRHPRQHKYDHYYIESFSIEENATLYYNEFAIQVGGDLNVEGTILHRTTWDRHFLFNGRGKITGNGNLYGLMIRVKQVSIYNVMNDMTLRDILIYQGNINQGLLNLGNSTVKLSGFFWSYDPGVGGVELNVQNGRLVCSEFILESNSIVNLNSGVIECKYMRSDPNSTINQNTGTLIFKTPPKINGNLNTDFGTTWYNITDTSYYVDETPNYYNLKLTTKGSDSAKFINELSCNNLELTEGSQLFLRGGTGNLTSNDTIKINGDLILKNGALFNLYDSTSTYTYKGQISLGGNIQNQGTIDAKRGSEIILSGSQNQYISGNSLSLHDFTIAKPNGIVQLNTPVQITDTMVFEKGIVQTSGANLLSFGLKAIVKNTSNVSHVDGPVKKSTNVKGVTFTFPVGNGSRYRSVAITPKTGSKGDVTVWIAQYFDTGHVDTLVIDSKIEKISKVEYWDVHQESGNAKARLWLSWDDSSLVSDLNDLILAHYDLTKGGWEKAGDNTSGNTSSGTISTPNDWEDFSPFTLGSKNGNNPLPISLLYFDAKPEKQVVKVIWETATEINNDHFTIQRSKDGVNFEELTTVSGAGNSNRKIEYELYDENPLQGVSYYRLKQTDYDGTNEVFDPVKVYINNEATDKLSIYPNPVIDYINIDYQNEDVEHIIIEVYNAIGKKIEGINKMKDADASITQLNLENLNPGLYFIQIQDGTGKPVVKKFIKK